MYKTPFQINNYRCLTWRLISVLFLFSFVLIGGCSEISKFRMFDFLGFMQTEVTSHSHKVIRQKGNIESSAAKKQSTPKLSSVPSRPKSTPLSVREKVVKGLFADREKAKFLDGFIRLFDVIPKKKN
ncbi:MAG: hypothetical protein CL568_07635 [Alphaproteobacteria bacterium]|jgi:hypothetical protein|nr:hypothetical protein [Alphaproteobacteria bacterium]PPR12425.1 MAG: hypothetical protein CFH42_02248 [Alphaproteobacteria bacterium MarineAlpha12_Bin1]|tara:strand:+ start:4564 stop:4944 length:381 start_codon:yes stop_codon:yes gene_type:complete